MNQNGNLNINESNSIENHAATSINTKSRTRKRREGWDATRFRKINNQNYDSNHGAGNSNLQSRKSEQESSNFGIMRKDSDSSTASFNTSSILRKDSDSSASACNTILKKDSDSTTSAFNNILKKDSMPISESSTGSKYQQKSGKNNNQKNNNSKLKVNNQSNFKKASNNNAYNNNYRNSKGQGPGSGTGPTQSQNLNQGQNQTQSQNLVKNSNTIANSLQSQSNQSRNVTRADDNINFVKSSDPEYYMNQSHHGIGQLTAAQNAAAAAVTNNVNYHIQFHQHTRYDYNKDYYENQLRGIGSSSEQQQSSESQTQTQSQSKQSAEPLGTTNLQNQQQLLHSSAAVTSYSNSDLDQYYNTRPAPGTQSSVIGGLPGPGPESVVTATGLLQYYTNYTSTLSQSTASEIPISNRRKLSPSDQSRINHSYNLNHNDNEIEGESNYDVTRVHENLHSNQKSRTNLAQQQLGPVQYSTTAPPGGPGSIGPPPSQTPNFNFKHYTSQLQSSGYDHHPGSSRTLYGQDHENLDLHGVQVGVGHEPPLMTGSSSSSATNSQYGHESQAQAQATKQFQHQAVLQQQSSTSQSNNKTSTQQLQQQYHLHEMNPNPIPNRDDVGQTQSSYQDEFNRAAADLNIHYQNSVISEYDHYGESQQQQYDHNENLRNLAHSYHTSVTGASQLSKLNPNHTVSRISSESPIGEIESGQNVRSQNQQQYAPGPNLTAVPGPPLPTELSPRYHHLNGIYNHSGQYDQYVNERRNSYSAKSTLNVPTVQNLDYSDLNQQNLNAQNLTRSNQCYSTRTSQSRSPPGLEQSTISTLNKQTYHGITPTQTHTHTQSQSSSINNTSAAAAAMPSLSNLVNLNSAVAAAGVDPTTKSHVDKSLNDFIDGFKTDEGRQLILSLLQRAVNS